MEYLNIKPEELEKLFTGNLLATNRGFNYYVDWTNIDGYQEFLVEIHAMDILIRCDDDSFEDKFYTLVKKLPTVILLFPYLFFSLVFHAPSSTAGGQKALWES